MASLNIALNTDIVFSKKANKPFLDLYIVKNFNRAMSEGPPEKWQKGIVQQEKNPAQLGKKNRPDLQPLKGLCHEIFIYSSPSGPLINWPKYFRIWFQFRRDILAQSCLHGVRHTASQTVFIVFF